MSSADPLIGIADELYASPPASFTAGRDATAKDASAELGEKGRDMILAHMRQALGAPITRRRAGAAKAKRRDE